MTYASSAVRLVPVRPTTTMLRSSMPWAIQWARRRSAGAMTSARSWVTSSPSGAGHVRCQRLQRDVSRSTSRSHWAASIPWLGPDARQKPSIGAARHSPRPRRTVLAVTETRGGGLRVVTRVVADCTDHPLCHVPPATCGPRRALEHPRGRCGAVRCPGGIVSYPSMRVEYHWFHLSSSSARRQTARRIRRE